MQALDWWTPHTFTNSALILIPSTSKCISNLLTHLGVSASVHRGNLVWGGNSHNVHSKQGVKPGRMTRAWPLKPSVPPSTMGLMVSSLGLPSSSNSARRVGADFLLEAKPRGKKKEKDARSMTTLLNTDIWRGATYNQVGIDIAFGAAQIPCHRDILVWKWLGAAVRAILVIVGEYGPVFTWV